MSHLLLRTLTVTLLGLATATSVIAQESSSRPESPRPGAYKRIVLLKFKEGTSPQLIEQLTQGIRALGPKIPAIATLDVGHDLGTQNLSQGFTHAVLLTFHSEKDRNEFLVNPVHKEYETKVLVPHLDKVLVVEFLSPRTP